MVRTMMAQGSSIRGIDMRKDVLKSIVFITLAVCMIAGLVGMFNNQGYTDSRLYVEGFYKEREDSLDAVFIGTSAVTRFWDPMKAWETSGIAVYPYATSAQPFIFIRYLMEEALKTQSPELFIIDLRGCCYSLEKDQQKGYLWLIDNMPESETRSKMEDAYFEFYKENWDAPINELPYRFPFLIYRQNWSDIDYWAYSKYLFIKGTCLLPESMLTKVIEESSFPGAAGGLDQTMIEMLEELMDFIEEANQQVLFVIAPKGEGTNEIYGALNEAQATVEARGFTCLNFNSEDMFEAVGLDWETDFKDASHTNHFGSVKYTQYIANYLVENYALTDKRGQEDYADWDAELKKYNEAIARRIEG